MPSVAVANVEGLGPGTLLGRYRLVRELGRGAMGLVFLADDTVLKQRLCVKVLSPHLVHNPEAMERFHREIVLARRIAHRSVCRLHDLHQDNGHHFITMEYVEGMALRDLLAPDQRPLPIGRVTMIVKNICDALAAAHDVNVIHRDLKPANVMVCAGDEINLLDFGIATADDLRSSLTLPGIAIGTRHYIAPEVWSGHPASAKSDQFSVGVILYNCLTRQHPFKIDKELFLIEAMSAGPPPPPSTWRPEIARALDDIVLRALSFSPLHRFADVRALASAIAAVERGEERSPSHGARTTDAPLQVTESSTASWGLPKQSSIASEPTLAPGWEAVGSANAIPPDNRPGFAGAGIPGAAAMDEATADEGDPETQAAFRRPNGIARIIAVAAACTMGAVVALAWPRDVQTPSTDLQSDGSARAASDEPIGPPGENTDAARPMGEAVERDVADRAPPAKKPDEADERDPADRAPPMEQPELVVRRERAEQRAPRPQATDKQKRHSDARAAVQKAMQDRGVIVGDDAELDRLRTQSASAAKAQRLEEAIELLAQARRRATDVVVDQGFVNRKLVRFNARFDASTDAAARARVESVSTDVLNAMREGRSVDANRALNAGLAALARRGP